VADRGRDLKIAILTDVSKFDTEGPARDLDALGSNAKGAGSDLDALGSDARAAGGDVDALGANARGANLDTLGADARSTGSDLDALGANARGAGSDVDALAANARGANLDTLGADARGAGQDVDSLGADVRGAAGDVDRLDAAARGANLDRLGTDAKGAGADVQQLGADAKATAGKVDHAFDAIARSAQSNLRDKVARSADEGADSVKESAQEMGDELKSEAIEGAASFDGSMASVQDSVQSLAANALAVLGPLGAAIGVAGAAGLGMWRAQAEQSKEAISGLVSTMLDAGGQMDRASVIGKVREFAEDGSILKLRDQARDARIPVGDFLLALAGDASAMDRSRAAIKARDEQLAASVAGQAEFTSDTTDLSGALDNATGSLDQNAETLSAAQEAVDAYGNALGPAAEAQQALADSLDGFTDPLAVYTDALSAKQTKEQESAQATADATKSQTDSWQDYADDVAVSVSEYLTTLEDQVEAQEEWQTNMSALAGKVSEDTLAELARMGPEGAPLVAELATASDRQLSQLDDLFARRAGAAVSAGNAAITAGASGAESAAKGTGAAAGRGIASGIAAQGPFISQAAADAHADARRAFEVPIVATLDLDTRLFYSKLSTAEARNKAAARDRP